MAFIKYIIPFLLIGCNTLKQPIKSPIPIEGASAHWVSENQLLWDAGNDAYSYALYHSSDATIEIFQNQVSGDDSFSLEPGGKLDTDIADKIRHIANRPIFTLQADRVDIRQALKGQLVAVAFNEEGRPLRATNVQVHGVLDDLYVYDGQLGPVYNNQSISVKLWAPTAQSVTLSIFDDEKNEIETVQPNHLNPETGVWVFEGSDDWNRKFYRFTIEVYHRQNGRINQFTVTDPYSVSLSMNSQYSQFVNLADDPTLKPTGWDSLIKELPTPTDITLYEAHMRDFSVIDETVPEEHRSTYMAFTHNGEEGATLSNGMNHLRELANSGLTHLHLLPINDISTVNEDKNERVDIDDPFARICEVIAVQDFADECREYGDRSIRSVFKELAAQDPTTKKIQEIYSAMGPSNKLSDLDGFNWGYDPLHFNVPEGSYSTDAEGAQRILETREMVKALYEIGLKVVVDVVYNHTSAGGISDRAILDRIVPDYYQRLNPDSGEIETSTCCSNTAAEFKMMEKLILDSILLWAEHYKIDSFRFDLMGHHPKYVMENVLDALAGLTPEEHGVDGKNIYIYGEGWNFGEVENNRIFDQATQFMMGGTGIGNFNDRSRDAIRGGFHSWTGREQGFANGRFLFPNRTADTDNERELNALLDQADRIRVGMTGNLSTYPYINRNGDVVDGSNDMIGYTLMPQETVNYIDKHDNETLWDNTQTKLPLDMTMDDRIRVHMLSNAFINYGQGVPFYQLGTDILRSKSMDRNSYDSGDWYNAVDFTLETNNWAMGLPPARDNREQWDDHELVLRNENISIEKEDMELTHQLFKEQLQIRYSSPLFRLSTAEEIHKRVAFHNTGPDQVAGIIAMTISDGVCAGESIDPIYDGILVLFNSHMVPQVIDLNLEGMDLHPIHLQSADPIMKDVSVDDGSFVIPAFAAAVFVKEMGDSQGEFSCNPLSSE